ncbi:hypothetical protein GCM10025791_38230 [Halioxenophilus aromaticivorans]|uniref:SPOR domain-containing protein n=1 Tax=Halioxenophilus aromaticivorans TaxID=1306992 RepID=A0AAV3U7F9_9ALTE
MLALWIFFLSRSTDPAIVHAGPSAGQVQAAKTQVPLKQAAQPTNTTSVLEVSPSLADDDPGATQESQPEPVVAAAVEPEEELCTVVGPFNNLAQADILVEQLAALNVPASLQKIEVPVKKNFWLYLEPMASKAEALKKLAELHAQKIDSYIIPKGDLVNGISIGLFVESYRAEFRRDELADLGYDVKIRVDIRTAEQSYVVAKAKDAVNVSAATWAQLLEGGDKVTYKQNYCSDVASLL